jgi:hypothetical protein
MKLRNVLVVAAFALLPLPVLAQTVTYKGHEIEMEVGKGPVQCVLWERDEVRHEDPDGVTMEASATGLILIVDVDHGPLVAGKVPLDTDKIQGLQIGDDCTQALGGE